MDIQISYLGLVRNVIGRAEESVRTAPATTVGDLLDTLAARHGESFRLSVFRKPGGLRSLTQVCVNDRDIEQLQGLQTALGSGETVSVVVGVYPPEGG